MKIKVKLNQLKRYLASFFAIVLFVESVVFLSTPVEASSSLKLSDMGSADITHGKMISLSDISTYGGNYALSSYALSSDNRHFDSYYHHNTDASRLLYLKMIHANAGQKIALVANKEDTAEKGGDNLISGNKFYWGIAEYDSGYKLNCDTPKWLSLNESWTLGSSNVSEYANGVNQNTRYSSFKYFDIRFRWYNGNSSVGSGTELSISKQIVSLAYPIFYLVYEPFTYSFDLNGGNIDGKTGTQTLSRLGVTDVELIKTPTRNGYAFAGWKITSSDGKQKNKVYSADDLAAMLKDGKYYSSLFTDTKFEAQWTKYELDYPTPSQQKGFMYLHYTDANDTYYSWKITIDFGKGFTDHNVGPASIGGSNWEASNLSYSVEFCDDTQAKDKTPVVLLENVVGNDMPDGNGHFRNVTVQFLIPRTKNADTFSCVKYWDNRYGHDFVDESTDKDKSDGYYRTGATFAIEEFGIAVRYKDANADLNETSHIHVHMQSKYNEGAKNTITFDPKDPTEKGTDKVIAITDEDLPSITIPKKEYTATFYDGNTKVHDDIVNKWKFKGYYSIENGNKKYWYNEKGEGLIKCPKVGSVTLTADWEYQYFKMPDASAKKGYTFKGWREENTNSILAVNEETYLSKNTKYNVYYTPDTYTVSYNANGGTGSMGSNTATYDSTYTTASNGFSRTGYNFTGWNTRADGNGTSYAANVSFTYRYAGNITLYAQWTPVTYTVSCNLNGGTINGSNSYSRNYTVETDSFTLPKPVRTGYTFTGWTGSNGSIPQADVTISKGSTGDKSFTANWQAKKYWIRYTKGATDQPFNVGNTEYTYDVTSRLASIGNNKGRSYTITFNNNGGNTTISSRTGNLTFAGWKINGTVYGDNAEVFNLTSESTTLTAEAQWNNTTEGNFGSVSRTGYQFAGWYDNTNGTGNAITQVTISPSTSGFSKVLYAKWTANTYYVRFNPNRPDNPPSMSNVQGSMSNQTFTYDTAKALTANGFSLAGYRFKGWSLNPGVQGVKFTNMQTVKNLTTVNGGIVDVYAQWEDLPPEAKNLKIEVSNPDVISTTNLLCKSLIYCILVQRLISCLDCLLLD